MSGNSFTTMKPMSTRVSNPSPLLLQFMPSLSLPFCLVLDRVKRYLYNLIAGPNTACSQDLF